MRDIYVFLLSWMNHQWNVKKAFTAFPADVLSITAENMRKRIVSANNPLLKWFWQLQLKRIEADIDLLNSLYIVAMGFFRE